jgi:hypothetical protein
MAAARGLQLDCSSGRARRRTRAGAARAIGMVLANPTAILTTEGNRSFEQAYACLGELHTGAALVRPIRRQKACRLNNRADFTAVVLQRLAVEARVGSGAT